MPWGAPGVSKNLRISNGVQNWGAGGSPTTINIQQTGILEALRLLVVGTGTGTVGSGTIARDVLGPWNALSNVFLSPNQQAPIISLSGYGLYIAQLMRTLETEQVTPDTVLAAETNAAAVADVYSFPSNGTGSLRFFEDLPVSQVIKSVGGRIGMWPLQNPAIQLMLQLTPNSASGATPFNAYSTTAGAAPYLTTSNATVTVANPTFEVIRNLWQVPASKQDFPAFNLVNTVIEEAPQGVNVNGATAFQWLATPLAGLLVRLGVFIFDGTTNTGVAASNMTASNALQLTYDNDTVKYAESAYAAEARQSYHFGFQLPQGVFIYDLLGKDLTLQDSLNTSTTGNIKFKATFNAALGSSNSFAKIIKQTISPLEVK